MAPMMIDHNSRAIELESPTISPKKDIKKPAKDAGSLDVYLMVPEAGHLIPYVSMVCIISA